MELGFRFGLLALVLLPTGAAAQGFFIPDENPGHAVARMRQFTARFRPTEVRMHGREAVAGIKFLNAQPATLQLRQKLPGLVHYLRGSQPEKWRTNAAVYGQLVYRGLYPGTEVIYSGTGGRLKSEFRLAPGADPARVRLRYTGVTDVQVAPTGDLQLKTTTGEVRETAPEAYQIFDGHRRPVLVSFRVFADSTVGFTIGAYDRSRELIIDPEISFSTLIGSSGIETATAVAVDSAGNAYLVGWTDGTDLAVTTTSRNAGGVDAFVAKLNRDGTLAYCTYLGGAGDDRAFGVAVDAGGNTYVAGWTSSTNFPLVQPFQSRLGGGRDAFIAKLNPAGSGLVYSTYFGGGGNDSANAIAIDAAGNVYFAGETLSTNLPVANAFQWTSRGQTDAFVAKLFSFGSSLAYSTYLGGGGEDRAAAIALDAFGNAYVAGGTTSSDFPTASAFQAKSGGGQDAFVVKLSSAGNSLVYSTYLGGSGGLTGYPETATAIAVDVAGNAYVTGTAHSTNFPLAGPLQSVHAGGLDAFVAKLNSSGTSLLYSTYLGGASMDYASSIRVDSSGSAYVAGYTASSNLPVQNALQATNAGGYDGFLAQLSANGASLSRSTYLGGSGSDAVNSLAISANTVYLAGQTSSSNFPLKTPLRSLPAGGLDAFLTRIEPPPIYQGVVDATTCASVVGWAWDVNQPNTPLDLNIYDGATLLATITANGFRSDLLAAGIGNGYHGFNFVLPAALKDGRAHSIGVKLAGTDAYVALSPASVTCTGVEGVVDSVSCTAVDGWAWDRAQPNTPVSVDIYDGSTMFARILAGGFRSDLQVAGIGNGYHGFHYPLPLALKDGRPHTMHVRIAGSAIDLGNSGRVLTCPAPVGVDDLANCSSLAGWAWDSTLPNTPLQVEIYDGVSWLATIAAGNFRPDLKAGGIGNGYHAYSYPLPAALKDGMPHTIRVKIAQTAIELANTGRSLTCTGP